MGTARENMYHDPVLTPQRHPILVLGSIMFQGFGGKPFRCEGMIILKPGSRTRRPFGVGRPRPASPDVVSRNIFLGLLFSIVAGAHRNPDPFSLEHTRNSISLGIPRVAEGINDHMRWIRDSSGPVDYLGHIKAQQSPDD